MVFCTIGVGGTGPSCSLVLEKLFHFSSRKLQGTAQEQPCGLMRSQRGATRGDSLGVICGCTSPLRAAAGKRIWKDMSKVSAKEMDYQHHSFEKEKTHMAPQKQTAEV